jgi:hypothetical protein
MADPIVRQMAFYWQDKKAAEVNKLRVKFMSGRKELFGQDGILAFSRGAAQMELSISEITPIGGSSTSNDIQKFFDQADIDASWIMGGKYYRQKLAWTEAEYDSDSETGVVTGQITLKGRVPQITG